MYHTFGCPAATRGKHDMSALSLKLEQACLLYTCKLALNMCTICSSPEQQFVASLHPRIPFQQWLSSGQPIPNRAAVTPSDASHHQST